MATGTNWEVQAALLELLAFSFRYPDQTAAEAVYSQEWLGAALEIAEILELKLPEGFAEAKLAVNAAGEQADDAEAFMHVLRAEATRLFVGTPEAVTSPYEGVWRAKDDGVQALLFVNPHSMAVERYFKSCGLGRPEGTNEPLDHVATELEFMQYLSMLEAGTATPPEGATAADALPGGSPAATYAQFVEEHASVWMPRFAAAVEEQTRLPYYRAAAQLLAAFFA